MSRTNQSATVVTAAREGYEVKVAAEALQRAGRNPQLKGVVHEVMFRDALNAKPAHALSGTRAVLTESTTAVRDDVLLKQGSKVVGRFQLKDTAGTVKKTVEQVAKGKYARTALVGTEETTKAYSAEVAKAGGKITQKMASSGIKSTSTARIADKALGQATTLKNLGAAAKGAGAVGGVLSAGIEAVGSYKDFRNGSISGAEYAGRVAKEGVKGGTTAAAATVISSAAAPLVATAATTAASTAAGAAVATGLVSAGAATAAVAAAPVVVAGAIAVAAGYGIKKLWDSIW